MMDLSKTKIFYILQLLALLAICQGAPQGRQESHESLPVEVPTDTFPVAESPLEKPIHSAAYVDFINKLYSHDTSKVPIHLDPESTNERLSRSQRSLSTEDNLEENVREKRGIVFRPLFVYKQQQIKREKLKEDKKKKQQAASQQKPTTTPQKKPYTTPQKQTATTSKPNLYIPANHSNFIVYNNKIYTQYNPYYAPYQYGQKYPYQKL